MTINGDLIQITLENSETMVPGQVLLSPKTNVESLTYEMLRTPVSETTKQIFESVFSWRRSNQEWEWRYEHKMFGIVAAQALTEGKAVAHFGGYPNAVSIRGTEYDAYQICDVMTAPSYRNGQVLKKTVDRLIQDRLDQRSLFLMYGFNCGVIRKFGMLKLGYYSKTSVPLLRKSPRPLSRKRISTFHYSSIRHFTRKFDLLYHECKTEYACLFGRTAAYLNWRFLASPVKSYLCCEVKKGWLGPLVGYVIFSKEGTALKLIDFLIRRSFLHSLPEILDDLLCKFSRRESLVVETWHPTYSPAYSHLLRWGLEPTKSDPQLYLTVRTWGSSASTPEWLDENLYYTMGDSDLH